MRPIVLKGHERPLTQVIYNREGDLLFSTARDTSVSVWYAHNGERLGTLEGHGGAVMTIDVDPTTTVAMTGASDMSMKLWKVDTGEVLYSWQTKAAPKRIEFSPDANTFLVVTEQHMGQKGSIKIFPIVTDGSVPSETEPILEIDNTTGDANQKVTFAAWTYDGQHIVAGHANGSISRYNATTGEQELNVEGHEGTITDLQMSPDRTHFVTASKDKTAKLFLVDELEQGPYKTYFADAPMNTAAITPVKEFVVLGGGQEARDVTTTGSREGKFQSRFFHKLFEDELGQVKGHFGPINSIAVHPKGTAFASGGEDGYIRVHHFEKSYYDFVYDTERQ